MSDEERKIQQLKIAIALCFGIYFFVWSILMLLK